MNGEYVIYRRNRLTGLRDTLLQRYTDFDLTLNWGEVSKFSISGKTIGAVELAVNDGLCFYRNGELLFSGIVTELTIKCDEVSEDLKEWTANGFEDSIIFSHYLTFADPTMVTFADGVTDEMSDYADARQIYYIWRNMGAGAMNGRQIAGLTLPASENRGQNTASAYRYQELDKALQEIGDEVDDGVQNGLYPRYIWNPDTGAKSVIIPSQRDMTEAVTVAPEYGNIIEWKKVQYYPTCNAVWVCSADFKDDQDKDTRIWEYAEDADSVAKFGRIEKVVTASDVKVGTYDGKTTTEADARTLLKNKAKSELEDGAYKQKFSGTMVETPELRFMVDWRCGDLITAVIDGERFSTTIKTVQIKFADAFEEVTPTLGDLEKGIFADVFRSLGGLDERMKQKELS